MKQEVMDILLSDEIVALTKNPPDLWQYFYYNFALPVNDYNHQTLCQTQSKANEGVKRCLYWL